jgi:hypothetical protein
MAMRWWFRGENERSLVDQYVCYWTALEVLASFFPDCKTVSKKILALLNSTYMETKLLSEADCRTVRDKLYKVRNLVFHRGRREATDVEPLINFARHTVDVFLKKSLDLDTPCLPGDQIMALLGLRKTSRCAQ